MSDAARLADEICQVALSFPESCEESPWGDRVVKVKKKIFVFLGSKDGIFHFTVKLPVSGAELLKQPWAEPTGYGLGKHGWVSMRLAVGQTSREQLVAWLDESYRSVAPKKAIATLDRVGLVSPAPKAEASGPVQVVLVGDDPLRLQRAVAAFAERGMSAVTAPVADDTIDLVADAPLRVVVVDLGRNATEALELAGRLAMVAEAPLALVGARDAEGERRARQALPTAVLVSREAPGDVVAPLLVVLG
jgi:predicted DNA-binding protein (MmcQ/YjbR family)